jgi:hypothetical protein
VIEKIGIRKRIADIVTFAKIGEIVKYNEGDTGFFFKNKISDEKMDIVFGKNDIHVFEDGENTINLAGVDPFTGFGFKLKFERVHPSWPVMEIFIGSRNTDKLMYNAYMPTAKVTGKIGFDGNLQDFNGFGYHDHDWGRLTSIQWMPWIVAKGKNVAMSALKTPFDSFIGYQSDSFKIHEKIDTIQYINIQRMHREGLGWIDVPGEIICSSSNEQNTILIRTKINSGIVTNMGYKDVTCLAYHDLGAKTTIEVYERLILKELHENLSTTFYYWNPMLL